MKARPLFYDRATFVKGSERSFVLLRNRLFYLQFHYNTSRCSQATPINSANYYFSNCIIKLLFKRARQFSIVRGIFLRRMISRINVICLLRMERCFRGCVINRKPAIKIEENGTKVARRERDKQLWRAASLPLETRNNYPLVAGSKKN